MIILYVVFYICDSMVVFHIPRTNVVSAPVPWRRVSRAGEFVPVKVSPLSNWDFSPFARLSHLRSFLISAERIDIELFMFDDGVQLLKHLPPTLEVLRFILNNLFTFNLKQFLLISCN
jgi:hypothetical protein